MIVRLVVLLVLAVGLTACAALPPAPVKGAARPSIELVDFVPPGDVAGLPVIRWVAAGDSSWQQGPPAWEVSDASGTSARGWLAVTSEHILMHIVVTDNAHTNTRERDSIWDGDALQIGVDAWGDGSGSLPPDTHMTGPDDASITVALTPRGTEVWAHFQGTAGTDYLRENGARAYPCKVTRDEGAKTTTYEVAFPWSGFGGAAGLSPALGLCVQVNDTDEGKPDQLRLYWGRGADGEPRPGLFSRLAVGGPPAPMAISRTTRSAIWRPSGPGEMAFAVASDKPATLTARLGASTRTFALPKASLAAGIRRFVLRGTPGALPRQPVPFEAELRAQGAVLTSQKTALSAPGLVIEQLHDQVEKLVAGSRHPLFTRHLRSVDAMVQSAWNSALLLVDGSPGAAEGVVRDARAILTGLQGDAGRWESYAAGRRALVLARVAGPDSTVQYYTLSLPRNWEAGKAYPLIVDLHGAGPSQPLFYVGIHFGPQQAPAAGSEEPVTEEPYFNLMPWARGNNGYTGFGEDDVWQALDEVTRNFTVDPDRVYLTGHSMGGGGTSALALRTPDRWAAACPCAGGTWNVPLGVGLGQNAAYLPFRIWHGEADGAVPVSAAYAMRDELRQYGNEPDIVIVPGQGHDYPSDHRAQNTKWLLQHRRKRPDKFSFVADTTEHRGAWGVWMQRDLAVSALPRFECRIEGNTVHITSEGTPGLNVQLGQGGLGLEGNVVVMWNGQKAYEGPVQEVTLGAEGRGRP